MTGDAVIFAPNSTEAVYTLTLIPDDIFEGGDEQLMIGLRALDSRGVVISQNRLTLSIIEDDSMLCVITHSALISNRGQSYTHIHEPLYLPFMYVPCNMSYKEIYGL